MNDDVCGAIFDNLKYLCHLETLCLSGKRNIKQLETGMTPEIFNNLNYNLKYLQKLKKMNFRCTITIYLANELREVCSVILNNLKYLTSLENLDLSSKSCDT